MKQMTVLQLFLRLESTVVLAAAFTTAAAAYFRGRLMVRSSEEQTQR
jgi:hypothetical protein